MILTTASVAFGQSRRFDYQHRQLANGLRVITLEDFSAPVVAVHVWYQVGAIDEDPNRQGFAHMFEHMMFRGTDRLGPTDHFEFIHRSGGDCNAYTSFDQTVYTNRLPANQLALALWLEAERMALLKIDEEGFVTERKVVEEERRMGLNRPYGTLFERLMPALFATHPYRWTPIGQIPHLRAATVGELRAFWHRYYVPNNATLVIVGAVRHDEAHKLAAEYLGWIPRRPDPPRVAAPADTAPAIKDLHIREPKGPVPIVGLTYRAMDIADPDRTATQFISEILGEGHSSRLYLDLVRRRKLATSVDTGLMALQRGGMFSARASLIPSGDSKADAAARAEVLDLLKQHVAAMYDQPVSERELTKARNNLLRNEVTAMMTVAGKASMIGRYAVLVGDLERANRRLDEIRAVTRQDVQRVAKKFLTADRLTVLTIEPDPSAKLDVPEDDAPVPAIASGQVVATPVTTRPDNFPADPPVKPLLEKMPPVVSSSRTLANGLKVVVLPDDEVPFVRMTLGLKFGAFSEARPGAAAMAARMITRGTRNYSAEQLADELEVHAISLSGHASLDTTEVNADCLSEHIELAGKLLAEVTLRPTFPGQEFDLLRSQVLNDLLVRSRTPTYIADRQFRARLFGEHPYSRTATGEPEDVNRLTVQDAAGWWRTFARPDVAVLYIAGDVTAEAGFALAEKWLGQWRPEGELPKVSLPAIPAGPKMQIFVVDQPGAVQSEIRVGHVSITRHVPEYPAARVLTHIFGGSFNSRLNQSLRVEKGLTYGVGGSFAPERFAGTFRMRTFTKTERTAEAVAALLEQVAGLESHPPTDEEMHVSRSYLVGSFAGSRETPQSKVNDMWMIESHALPEDFLERYLAGIRSAGQQDVVAVAKRFVHPERLTIVVVGDAEAIRANLEKIAPVTVVK